MSLFSKKSNKDKAQDQARDQAQESAQTEDTMKAGERKSAEQELIKDNPWIRGKQTYTDVYMGLASSAAQWRLSTFALLVLLMLSVIGNLTLARTVRVQPYVIQVDKHGYAIPIKMLDASGVDQRIISSQVGTFVYYSRMRLGDREAQIVFAENSYRVVAKGSRAEKTLTDYYRAAPPTQAKDTVQVIMDSIIPISTYVYEAQWTERSGSDSKSYSATFTIAVSPPTDVTNLVSNPMGVYITDYSVSQNIN
jgi:type IV secretory pathway TrbF-like protein